MSKISAAAKNAAGNIQEGIGKVFNSESMVAKGEQKQLEAEQQKIAADQKNSGNAHSAKGAAKQNVGEATHNPHMAAQGQAERHHGNVQHNAGSVNDPTNTTGAGLTATYENGTATSVGTHHPKNTAAVGPHSHSVSGDITTGATDLTGPHYNASIAQPLGSNVATGAGLITSTHNTGVTATGNNHHHGEYTATRPAHSHSVNNDISGVTDPTGPNHHSAHHNTSTATVGRPAAEFGSTHDHTYNNGTNGNGNASTMSGKKDQAMGAMKENVGSALNNSSLEARGAGQRNEGHFQEHAAKQQPGRVAGSANAASGAVKENVGYAAGNPSMELNGASQRAYGDEQYNGATRTINYNTNTNQVL
ncbi:hypothetical protein K493DRAFT_295548 [Basidiobolus meristosporus CBS 931.73]|uniref:CsbD-like domain-containing protein n=1 Tax=Basidiobolus meristosporus CBS 931.73 TaxID=1314790 RepID=A0A1Y1ZAM8_9FUNG|nr:hypothetical protein K493DRAFT_295548 [Basidiobolus meristosporus CBS 931.73]|eukprot:ORY07340.1 hypothetical protein K493DRAFT_295548 [Basidiobolus meristosporus CBS 931.73]